MELWITILFSPAEHKWHSEDCQDFLLSFSPQLVPHKRSSYLLSSILWASCENKKKTERDLQKSLEALRVPDLLWRREKRPFLLRKRLILARLAAGHVPASLPSPPAWRSTQPKSALRHLCAAPYQSSLPPNVSTQLRNSSAPEGVTSPFLSIRERVVCSRGEEGQRSGESVWKSGSPSWVKAVQPQPQPQSKPYGWATIRNWDTLTWSWNGTLQEKVPRSPIFL